MGRATVSDRRSDAGLAVDGLGLERDSVRRDVEDLTSVAFGPGVRVVAALDDVIAERLMLNSTGRKASAIGRRANRVTLGLLDNEEFEQAQHVMWDNRLAMMPGGIHAEVLRVPWVLRAVASRYEDGLKEGAPGLAAGVPPLLSGLSLSRMLARSSQITSLGACSGASPRRSSRTLRIEN